MRNLLLPPLVWMAAIVGIVLSHNAYPIVHIEPTNWRTALAVIIFFVGLLISVWHKQQFKKAGTTISTFEMPDKLLEVGLFRRMRNPMYLGFVVSLTAIALLGGALSSWVFVVVFFLISDRWYIPFEERLLRERFGKQYEEYRARTRRWV